MQWTSVLLSEALLAHDVYVCLERPSGDLPPEVMSPDSLGAVAGDEAVELLLEGVQPRVAPVVPPCAHRRIH